MLTLDENYWSDRYQQGKTQWDAGKVTTPLKLYFDSIKDKNAQILIPGGGNGHEAAYLHAQGFQNIYLLDISNEPLNSFRKNVSDFPENHIVHQDFFTHTGQYDIIIEQTFFCALDPSLREAYAKKMAALLKPKGVLTGLLFNDVLNTDYPPFGGNTDTYRPIFEKFFKEVFLGPAKNSIAPRAGRELWLEARGAQ